MTHPNNEPTRGSDVPRRTEVLVVGAGPTGLSLACGLAQRGIDHVVIDHAPRVAAYSQSAVIDARTLEVLDAEHPTVDDLRNLLSTRGPRASPAFVQSVDEAERRPVAEAVLGLTRKLSGVATLRGQAGQRIRNRTIRVLGRLPAFRQSLASRLSGFAGVKRSRAGREENQLLLASTRR